MLKSNISKINTNREQQLEKEDSLIEILPDCLEKDNTRNLYNSEEAYENIQEIDGEIFFSQEREEDNKNTKTSKDNEERFQIFDKAKENLLKIKNEIDELNQYDYNKKFQATENNNLNNFNSGKEIDIDE